MRRLLLLRHAKAVPHSKGGDIARELSPRGRRDAERMGRFMFEAGLLPDAILVSPSVRTRETLAMLTSRWPEATIVDTRRALYLGESTTLLEEVQEAPEDARSLLVIGHNPGLAEFALALTREGEPRARMRRMDGYPTCALAVLDCEISTWRGLTFHKGELMDFVTPDRIGE